MEQMTTCHRRKPCNFLLSLLFIYGIVYFSLKAVLTTYDNDLWWLLSTGREIVQNGIPYINPWAIHDGMKIVIQQWIPSVVLYYAYSAGGVMAIQLLLCVLIAVEVFVSYRLCEICSDSLLGKEIIFGLLLLTVIPMSAYFSSRPQIYSMIAFELVFMVLEFYRRTGKWKTLLWLPLISLIHVNIHASMAPFDLFLIAIYCLPDIPRLVCRRYPVFSVRFSLSEYRRIPLLAALLASALAMLVNPYGINGALYLLRSFGAASYGDYIAEMQPAVIWSTYGIPNLALIMCGCIAIGKRGIKDLDFPKTVLFVVGVVLSMTRQRNIWLLPLLSLPLLADSLGAFSLYSDKIRLFRNKAVCALVGVFLLFASGYYAYFSILPIVMDSSETDSAKIPYCAAQWMDGYAQEHGISKTDIKVCNSFNNGGYLEWSGLKVLMDARPELWEPPITGQTEHYYQEFVNYSKGITPTEEMIGKYPFDFYITINDLSLEDYLGDHSTKYEKVLDGTGYGLWINREIHPA